MMRKYSLALGLLLGVSLPTSAQLTGESYGQVVYVRAPVDGTDATTGWQNSINTLTPGGTLVCGPGTYALKSATLTINTNHVRILLDPKCILQAQTGFPSAFPIFQFQAGATDVYLGGGAGMGGVVDLNNIAGMLTNTLGAPSRITVEYLEVKNMVSDCIQFGDNTGKTPAQEFNVRKNYLHNCVGSAV